jgi:DNA-binding FadR family transcriptional regulator
MGIAAELRRRIAKGDFLPGDPLPSENDLTTELGYSKPVVREALRILETEGLLEVKRGVHGGPRIRRPSISEVAKPIGIYLQIGDVPVIDVWASRDRIVAAAVERLASMRDVDLAPLEEQVNTLVRHVGDIPTYYQHMIDTSETAVELAGNVTDYVLVVALRHIIEAELAAATAASDDDDVAVAAERVNAEAWQRTLRHIRAGQQRAARAAFERPALRLQAAFAARTVGVTVGDVVSRAPGELAKARAALTKKRRPDVVATRARTRQTR